MLRWWANVDGKVIIVTLPDSEDMRHQVRREALAGVLALEAAALEVDLSDAVVILRNDATGALSAFSKGSFSSTFLQQCAMRSCLLLRRVRYQTLLLHAPGRVLMDEGVDDHSRDGALEVAGPVSSALVRHRALAVLALAVSCGWTLSVDAFASESNSVLPRFFARYAEPAAECDDAFTVSDWGYSTCPACGCTHRETLFSFPPPPLLNAFVAKARADGARAVIVTVRSHPCPSPPPSGTSSCALPSSRTPRATSVSAGNRRGWTRTSLASLLSSLWTLMSWPNGQGVGLEIV